MLNPSTQKIYKSWFNKEILQVVTICDQLKLVAKDAKQALEKKTQKKIVDNSNFLGNVLGDK